MSLSTLFLSLLLLLLSECDGVPCKPLPEFSFALSLAVPACLHRTRGFVVAVPFLGPVLRMRLHLLQASAGTVLVLFLAI